MNNFKDKVLFISGGTGSLGQELTKQLLEYNPRKIIIFSRRDHDQVVMEKKFNDSRLRFFIGDIRDYERLEMALDGVDYFWHTAALKHVDRGEYNSIEYKHIIVDGAENIIKACLNRGVKNCVALSTDKACLYGECLVNIDNNHTQKIYSMVKKKYNKTVESYDERTGKIVQSHVYNWYKNNLNDRALYYVSYANARFFNSKRMGLIATDDHPILTTDGWKRLDELSPTDRLITSEIEPNEKQKALIIGTLLGDGNLSNIYIKRKKRQEIQRVINRRSSLNFSHGKTDKEWLELKVSSLKGISNSKIKETKNLINGKNYPQFRVFFEANAYFTDLFKLFYDINGVKRIPINLLKEYLYKYPEILLSTWFQDDGCKADNNIRLATHNFSLNDVNAVIEIFNEMGLECYIYHPKYKHKVYNEIRFTIKGTENFFKLTSKYIKLRRKIPLKFDNNNYTDSLWNLGTPIRYTTHPIVKLVDSDIIKPRNVFCLDIEKTHNFIVGGMIVHNCAPLGVYGASKLLSDKLFIAANRYSKTKFSVIRYGNVIASNGSIIQKMGNSNDNIIEITDRTMTRFWITKSYAAKLTIHLMKYMNGEEILIPKIPSMNVLSLLKCMKPNSKIVDIPIRPAEKIDESMILQEDSKNGLEFDAYYIIYPNLPDIRMRTFAGEVGRVLPNGFTYTSDNNSVMLYDEEYARKLLNDTYEFPNL